LKNRHIFPIVEISSNILISSEIYLENYVKSREDIMPFTLPNEIVDKNAPPNYEKELSVTEEMEHDSEVRKRIDDLLEKKRLKDLLDDEDDW